MTLPGSSFRDSLSAKVERLVCDEFELMEVCQLVAVESDGEGRARLQQQAGLCQVHLFDLESSLLDIRGRAADYSTCVRRSLGSLRRPSWRGALDRLMSRYQRVLGMHMPKDLRQLLTDNLNEHQRLAAIGLASEATRQTA